MPKLILDGQAVEDSFRVLREDDAIPDTGDILLSWSRWLTDGIARQESGQKTGVWLASDELVETLNNSICQADVVAIEFPKFADGRGFSTAYLLRSRLGYQGQLRAIGDILLDQLFYLNRVGFNAFAIPDDKSLEKGLSLLNPIRVKYQASTDIPSPLYRQTALA
ncbi:DUF934 domain-containing protein [Salinispirillum marinum]|uniref:DUF934 domain-containing protein n=2 Tax=Saccharospirillaceae TaxID=255527 RepID=A0ABV8BHP6_9GAMM